MKPLRDKRILLFVGDDYEDLELWYPLLRLQEAGAKTVVAGQKAAHAYRGKNGYPCTSDAAVEAVRAAEFDGVVVPGGWMPDKLRRDEHVLNLVREFDRGRKAIATICHGPWILISAGICRGKKMTSTPGIRDDLVNAGAEWVDASVLVDGHIVSSRRPPDLPDFMIKTIELLAGGRA